MKEITLPPGTLNLSSVCCYDYLKRLSSIASAPSGAGALSHAYSYNNANQRFRVNLADGSYWSYEYDALGQVKSGKRYWSDGTPSTGSGQGPVAGQHFEFGFDDIGNRMIGIIHASKSWICDICFLSPARN